MRELKFVRSVSFVVAALIGVGGASAADVGAAPYSKTPAYIVPAYDWSGGYIGVNVGYSRGQSADTSSLGTPTLFTDAVSSKMDGVLGGAQIGYNLQMQNWLGGLEADFQGTGQRSTHLFTCPAGVCTVTFGLFTISPGPPVPVVQREQLNFFGTIRARAGVVVVPTVLLYATAGLAYGQVDSNSTLVGSTRAQNYNLGWTAGGGLEGAIGGGWTAKLEYLYLDLGKVSGTFSSFLFAPTGLPLGSSFNSRITDNIVRAGLNYRFSGPVISKY